MMPSRRRAAPPVLAFLFAAAVGLAGCAGDDAHPDSVKNLSDISGNGQSMVRLGDASRGAGDCQAAIRFYRLVKDQDDRHAEAAAARAGTADCELSMNQLPDAERDYLAAAKLTPQDPAPLVGLGRVYLVEHRPGDAASYLAQAVKKGADAAFVWNDQGVAYDQLRRHKEAQQAYRAGLAKYPDDRALRNNLALSLAMTRDFAEAESLLRGLVADPSASARTRENLALVLGLEGNGTEARRVSQSDLDGAALDNNGRFYQYARALLTGESQTAAVTASEADDADVPTPAPRQHVAAALVPPPILVTDRPLKGLRGAEPSKLDESSPAIAQVDLPAPEAKKATPVQTASIPAAPSDAVKADAPKIASAASAPAPHTGPVVILAPTRIVASDGGALKTEPAAKAAGPVASSENQ